MMHIEEFVDQIILGDCLEVMRDIPDNSVDHIITDFPYNVGKNFANDNLSEKDYLEWIDNVCNELNRLLKNKGNFIFYIGTKNLPSKLSVVCRHFDYEWIIVQYKPTFRCFGKTGFTKTDLIMWFSKNGGKVFKKHPDIIVDKKEKLDSIHPSPKGNIVCENLVEIFTERGDIILDCFAGTGSIIKACKRLGRRFIGIEVDPEMCMIVKRQISILTNINIQGKL